MKRHADQPPDIAELLQLLFKLEIRFVVTGSVVAQFYGVELEPGDLDITPALDPENLQQLTQMLVKIEATPKDFGHWETKPDGEKRWIEELVTPEKLAGWHPDPEDISTLDHLFLTKYD